LASPAALAMILKAAGRDSQGTVLEIGPGRGVLTLPLAERFGAVIAVEKDERLAATLDAILKERKIANVRLHAGDILDLFPKQLNLPDHYAVVANIPYYLTGRLLRVLLESPARPKRMVLLVQREVAERMVAKPPHMNLLALSVQAYGSPHIVAEIPSTAFSPPPSVASAIIEVREISNDFFTHQAVPPEKFFSLLRAAFSGKRKMLINSLAKPLGGKDRARALLGESKLAANKRPEELSLNDWITLARIASH